ncbi:MAG: hypothetical protein AB7L71_17060 [Vicinamibacterales bacterium]
MERDPEMLEAQFRRARLRAFSGGRGVRDLEALADASNREIGYLAAVTRGMVAQRVDDWSAARSWFLRALEVRPGSTAARVGLSALAPGSSPDFMEMDAEDPFYDYPCRFLTPGVGEELGRRIAAAGGRR